MPAAASGPLLFASFAYPPNSLGYCGPDDSAALLEYATHGVEDGGLRRLAQGFDGAWPYLRLIAGANHIDDPLDARVVEAYWIGNALLDRLPMSLIGSSVDERFRRTAGLRWDRIAGAICAGSLPHHNFHVFAVYPWVGMLRMGRVDQPLRVLDRCRVRWGRVESVEQDSLVASTRRLRWSGNALRLGPPQPETARCRSGAFSPGDRIALHWDWACCALSPEQLRALQRHTLRELANANRLAPRDEVAFTG